MPTTARRLEVAAVGYVIIDERANPMPGVAPDPEKPFIVALAGKVRSRHKNAKLARNRIARLRSGQGIL